MTTLKKLVLFALACYAQPLHCASSWLWLLPQHATTNYDMMHDQNMQLAQNETLDISHQSYELEKPKLTTENGFIDPDIYDASSLRDIDFSSYLPTWCTQSQECDRQEFYYRHQPLPKITLVSTQNMLLDATFSGNNITKAYDCDGNKTNLSQLAFGKNIHVRDIFLASNIAEQGALALPGSSPAFGSTPSQQYIATLASTRVNINAKEENLCLELSSYYSSHFCVGQRTLGAHLGLILPIKRVERALSFHFTDSALANGPAPGTVENNLSQFFSDFGTDFFDFFSRGILAPKNIGLELCQTRHGIGDLAISALISAQDILCPKDLYQIGIDFMVPTGSTRSATTLWEIELGNGGAFEWKPFFAVSLETDFVWLNPMIHCYGLFSHSFHEHRRIPQLTSNRKDILLPSRFAAHSITPFEQLDTSVREFADRTTKAKINYGTEYGITIGDAWINICNSGASLAAYYSYLHKNKDTISAHAMPDEIFDTSILTRISKTRRHTICWNANYNYDNVLNWYIGSSHVVAGSNIPITHTLFASCSLSF